MSEVVTMHFGLKDVDPEQPGFALASHGGLATCTGVAAARQELYMLLGTMPGERVMEPDFGCHLHHLVYELNDDTTAGLAMHYVRQAITDWLPEITIIDITAGPDPDAPERLVILVSYSKPSADIDQDQIDVRLTLQEPS